MNNNNLRVSKHLPPPPPTLTVQQIPRTEGQALRVPALPPPPPSLRVLPPGGAPPPFPQPVPEDRGFWFTPMVPKTAVAGAPDWLRPTAEFATELTTPFDVASVAAISLFGPMAAGALRGGVAGAMGARKVNLGRRALAGLVDPIAGSRAAMPARVIAETGLTAGGHYGYKKGEEIGGVPGGIISAFAGGALGGVAGIGLAKGMGKALQKAPVTRTWFQKPLTSTGDISQGTQYSYDPKNPTKFPDMPETLETENLGDVKPMLFDLTAERTAYLQELNKNELAESWIGKSMDSLPTGVRDFMDKFGRVFNPINHVRKLEQLAAIVIFRGEELVRRNTAMLMDFVRVNEMPSVFGITEKRLDITDPDSIEKFSFIIDGPLMTPAKRALIKSKGKNPDMISVAQILEESPNPMKNQFAEWETILDDDQKAMLKRIQQVNEYTRDEMVRFMDEGEDPTRRQPKKRVFGKDNSEPLDLLTYTKEELEQIAQDAGLRGDQPGDPLYDFRDNVIGYANRKFVVKLNPEDLTGDVAVIGRDGGAWQVGQRVGSEGQRKLTRIDLANLEGYRYASLDDALKMGTRSRLGRGMTQSASKWLAKEVKAGNLDKFINVASKRVRQYEILLRTEGIKRKLPKLSEKEIKDIVEKYSNGDWSVQPAVLANIQEAESVLKQLETLTERIEAGKAPDAKTASRYLSVISQIEELKKRIVIEEKILGQERKVRKSFAENEKEIKLKKQEENLEKDKAELEGAVGLEGDPDVQYRINEIESQLEQVRTELVDLIDKDKTGWDFEDIPPSDKELGLERLIKSYEDEIVQLNLRRQEIEEGAKTKLTSNDLQLLRQISKISSETNVDISDIFEDKTGEQIIARLRESQQEGISQLETWQSLLKALPKFKDMQDMQLAITLAWARRLMGDNFVQENIRFDQTPVTSPEAILKERDIKNDLATYEKFFKEHPTSEALTKSADTSGDADIDEGLWSSFQEAQVAREQDLQDFYLEQGNYKYDTLELFIGSLSKAEKEEWTNKLRVQIAKYMKNVNDDIDVDIQSLNDRIMKANKDHESAHRTLYNLEEALEEGQTIDPSYQIIADSIEVEMNQLQAEAKMLYNMKQIYHQAGHIKDLDFNNQDYIKGLSYGVNGWQTGRSTGPRFNEPKDLPEIMDSIFQVQKNLVEQIEELDQYIAKVVAGEDTGWPADLYDERTLPQYLNTLRLERKGLAQKLYDSSGVRENLYPDFVKPETTYLEYNTYLKDQLEISQQEFDRGLQNINNLWPENFYLLGFGRETKDVLRGVADPPPLSAEQLKAQKDQAIMARRIERINEEIFDLNQDFLDYSEELGPNNWGRAIEVTMGQEEILLSQLRTSDLDQLKHIENIIEEARYKVFNSDFDVANIELFIARQQKEYYKDLIEYEKIVAEAAEKDIVYGNEVVFKGPAELENWIFSVGEDAPAGTFERLREFRDSFQNTINRSEVKGMLLWWSQANALQRMVALGFDASIFNIHLLPVLFNHPEVNAVGAKGFVEAFYKTMKDKEQGDIFVQNFRMKKENIDILGLYEGQILMSESNEVFEILKNTALGEAFRSNKITGNLGASFENAFNHTLDIAGIELAKGLDHLVDATADAATQASQRKIVADYVNSMRGLFSSGMLGINPNQSLWESILLLAPRYRRAIGALFVQALQGDPLRRYLAQKALINTATGLALTTVLLQIAASAMGEDEPEELQAKLNRILDPSASDFLLFDMNGQKLGPGSKFVSDARILSKAMNFFYKTGTQEDMEEWESFVSLSEDNPGLRWVRSQLAYAPTTAWNFFTGADYMGDPAFRKGDSDIDTITNFVQPFTDMVTPLWLSSVGFDNAHGNLDWGDRVSSGATRGISEFTGLRSYPQGAAAILREASFDIMNAPYTNLEPFEKDILRDSVMDQLSPMQAQQVKRGKNDFALYFNDVDRINKDFQSELIEMTALYPNTPEGNRNMYDRYRQLKSYRRGQLHEIGYDIEFDEPQPSDVESKNVLNKYYKMFDSVRIAGTQLIDWDLWEIEYEKLMNSLSLDQQLIIARNTSRLPIPYQFLERIKYLGEAREYKRIMKAQGLREEYFIAQGREDLASKSRDLYLMQQD